MKTLLTLLFFVIAVPTFGQNGKLFKGTLNKTIKITFYLEGLDEGTNADPILGAYKYDNQKEYILLNGYINNDGNIVLVEQSTVNFSGVFLGNLNQEKIKGTWTSANQNKSFSFELTKTVATKEQLAKFKNAITDKIDEFRNY